MAPMLDRSMHGSIHDEVERLRKKVVDLQNDRLEVDTLRKDFAKVQGEKANLEMEFMKQLNALASENALVIEEYEGRITESEKVNRALAEQLGASSNPKMIAEEIRNELEATYQSEINALRDELTQSEQEKEGLASQTITELEANQKEVCDLQTTIKHLETELGKSRNSDEDLKRKLKSLRQENASLLAKHERWTLEYASETTENQKQRKELEKKLATTEVKVMKLTSTLETERQSKGTTSREWKEAEVRMSKECDQLIKKGQGLESDNALLKSTNEALQAENQTSKHEIARLTRLNQKLEKSKLGSQGENRRELQFLRNANEQLEKESRGLKASIEKLERDHKTLRSSKPSFSQEENLELQKLQADFQDLSVSKKSLEKENLELKASLAKLEKHTQSPESVLPTNETKVQRLRKVATGKTSTKLERPWSAARTVVVEKPEQATIEETECVDQKKEDPAVEQKKSYEKRTTQIIRRLEQNLKREGMHKQTMTAGLKFRKQKSESERDGSFGASFVDEDENSSGLEALQLENTSLSGEVEALKQKLEKEQEEVEGLRREVSDLRASCAKIQPEQSPRVSQIPLYGGPVKYRLKQPRTTNKDSTQEVAELQQKEEKEREPSVKSNEPTSELKESVSSRRRSAPSPVVIPTRHFSMPSGRRSSYSPKHLPPSPSKPLPPPISIDGETPPPTSTDEPTKPDGKRDPSHPRTPVRGLVQCFERRISKNVSTPPLLDPEEEESPELNPPSIKRSLTDTNSGSIFPVDEIDGLKRTIRLERQQLQDLEEELTRQCEINCSLLKEINALTIEAEKSRVTEANQFEKKCFSDQKEIEILSSEVSRLRSQVSKSERLKWPPVAAVQQVDKSAVAEKNDITKLKNQAEDLRKQLSETEEALKKFQEKNMSQQEEIESLTSQVRKLNAQLNDVNELKTTLVEDFERSSKNDQGEIRLLHSKINKLSSQLLEVDGTKSRLSIRQEDINKLEGQVKELQAMLGESEEARNLLVLEQDETKATLTATREEGIKNLEGQVEELQAKLGDSEEARNQLVLEQDKTKATMTATREEAGRLRALVEEQLTPRVSELQAKLSQTEDAKKTILAEQADTKLELMQERELVNRLETRVSELSAQVMAAEARNSDAVSEQASTRLADMEEIKCLKQKVETLSSELESGTERRDELESKVKELNAELESATERRDKLESKVEKLNAALESVTKKRDELESKVETLNTEVESATKRRDELESKVETLDSELTTVAKRRDDLENKSERLYAQVDSLTVRRDELEIKVETLHSELNTMTERRDELESKVKSLQSELSFVTESRDELESKVETLNSELNSVSENRDDAFEALKSQVDGKVAQFQQTHSEDKEQIERLRSQVEALRQELCDTLEQVEDLKKEREEKEDVDAAVEEMTRVNQRSFDAQISKLQMELNKAKEVESEQMSQIQVLESDLNQIRQESEAELDDFKRGVGSKEDMIAQLVKEKDQLVLNMNDMASTRRNELEELQVELMEMSTKAASQAREVVSLKQQLADTGYRQEEVEGLRRQLRVLSDQVAEREDLRMSEKTALEVENSDLRQRLRSANLDCQVAEEKLRDFVADKGSSKTVQVLRERNSALKHEVEKLTKKLRRISSELGHKKQHTSMEEQSNGSSTRFMI